jgi:hypothetical protein
MPSDASQRDLRERRDGRRAGGLLESAKEREDRRNEGQGAADETSRGRASARSLAPSGRGVRV